MFSTALVGARFSTNVSRRYLTANPPWVIKLKRTSGPMPMVPVSGPHQHWSQGIGRWAYQPVQFANWRNRVGPAGKSPASEETMKVHEIPGTLLVEWNEEVKAMVDTWSTYTITVPQFREAILSKGLKHARAHRGRAWVMDATNARGAFPRDIQELIETEVFKAFAANGIKYFITIKSASALTNMAIRSFTAHLGPCGIQMVEVPDQTKAIDWLKEHP